jgi:hypothetical protein
VQAERKEKQKRSFLSFIFQGAAGMMPGSILLRPEDKTFSGLVKTFSELVKTFSELCVNKSRANLK